MTHFKLIEKYKNADCYERLNIYLQFPEVRSEFMGIELNGIETETL